MSGGEVGPESLRAVTLRQFWADVKAGKRPAPAPATRRKGITERVTAKDFGHYRKPIVVTLALGTDKRDDLIGMRLKGTRHQVVGRIADVYRMLCLWHGNKEATAKRHARKNGVPWKQAKKQFEKENGI